MNIRSDNNYIFNNTREIYTWMRANLLWAIFNKIWFACQLNNIYISFTESIWNISELVFKSAHEGFVHHIWVGGDHIGYELCSVWWSVKG